MIVVNRRRFPWLRNRLHEPLGDKLHPANHLVSGLQPKQQVTYTIEYWGATAWVHSCAWPRRLTSAA